MPVSELKDGIRTEGPIRAGKHILRRINRFDNATNADQTYTPDQMLQGCIFRDIGAARTDTTPTAAEMWQAMGPDTQPGDGFEFIVFNSTAAVHALTVAGGADVIEEGTMTIAADCFRRFWYIALAPDAGVLVNVGGGAI